MSDKIKTRGRGRPRAFDRETALDQAQTLFHAHGYEGVGVAALADMMGINPPSLYAAFGSKAALYAEVLDRYSRTSPLTEPLAVPATAPAEALADLLHRAARIYSADPAATGCLVLEGERSTDADAACRARTCKAASVQQLRAVIARTHPDRADALADYVAAVMSGMSADARAGHSTERLIAVADIAALAIAAMLRAD
ncbi:TetR/AcrR family transcriptional regulator [Sphingobium limneticum]|uniref:TetR/AcrR family transcriptional regulator n=1 Tax=Sphingobium limneticum TaxID=1007511 RepID=A0A5J5IA11_9SPHN|nr:TetR/AcrR family transcriptional regulator [Sphingobium limneticum]KAA9020932.1 TetR/AcrR family transcriptional regulator [Sphingobium limneticum]KAA9033259.1 TetR/AcrR family transcriptional regulator [Sphingobium limneticum]